MKIAFITTGFLPMPAVKGGAVENLVDNLIKKNEEKKSFEFEVFSIYDEKALRISSKISNTKFNYYKPNFLIKKLDKLLFLFITRVLKKEKRASYRYLIQRILYLNKVSGLLRKNNYDKVIIENNATLFLALKWKKNYLKYKDRYYYHIHNEIDSLYGCEDIIVNCKNIICISKFIQDSIIKKIAIKKEKTSILKNCIDIDRFSEKISLEEKEQIRKKFGFQNDDIVLLFTGRMVEEKGIEKVIDAVSMIKNEKIKLLVAGNSFSGDTIKSEFEKKLDNKVAVLGDRIKFTGFIDYKIIHKIYSIADIAILPSLWEEPAGLTILETTASGIPLITTNSGGILEYIDRENAIVLERNNQLTENIVKYVNMLINDKKWMTNMSQKERNNAKKYNLDNYFDEFQNLINNI